MQIFLKNSHQTFLWHSLIYCKCGYFCCGKILQNCWQDYLRWGNFHDTNHVSFIKAYGFYFRVGVFSWRRQWRKKTRKLQPCKNVHVYSMILNYWVDFCSIWFNWANGLNSLAFFSGRAGERGRIVCPFIYIFQEVEITLTLVIYSEEHVLMVEHAYFSYIILLARPL